MAAGATKQQKARKGQSILKFLAESQGGVYQRNVTTLPNGVQLSVVWSNASNGETFGALKAVNPANNKIAQSNTGRFSELLAAVARAIEAHFKIGVKP